MHRPFATLSRWLSLPAVAMILTLALVACGGGGSGGSAGENTPPPPPAPAPPAPQPPEPTPLTQPEAVRFLSQASFGPSERGVEELLAMGLEAWFQAELGKSPTLHLETVLAGFPGDGSFIGDNGNLLPGLFSLPRDSFWRVAIEGEDQLRQRMAFALSQILVVSSESALSRAPQTIAHYMDILTTGAFGNYRDLLEAVTYSPAMAVYLTYLRNEKADPLTGRVPDENYARELLQLFTLGLIALQSDGTPATDGNGVEIELYDNSDVTELAKVFTGLSFAGAGFKAPLRQLPLQAYYSPLETFDAFHSPEVKQFLGVSIPAGTGAEASISQALDAIFAHPNVGPFIGRQLIQRFVTSSPEPAYVERVAAAFDAGSYTLPSGSRVGDGRRGDLAATLAAVLFDSEARDPQARLAPGFGKLREPVLRFTHWARAFAVNSADVSNEAALRDTARTESLGQQPYGSPSVFNFYRPGYIAPGTQTGNAELTAPELQITNATTIVGYPNFLTLFALGNSPRERQDLPAVFVPDYSAEAALADDVDALLEHLDNKLTHGTLSSTTRDRIAQIVTLLDASTEEGRQLRGRVASVLVMTSPEYIVLR